MTQRQTLLTAAITLLALLLLSGMHAFDRATWMMEVFPVAIALPVMWASYPRYPLTNLLYACLFLHALVLITGGAYTYAQVPLGFQIEELFHLSRNPYDKIGHFMQGFVPALLAREIFIRGQFVHGSKMLAFLVICVALAISAAYEIVEWTAAIVLGQGADAFLGTQGYVWDTQSDMLFALIGASTSLLLFARMHDRQLRCLMHNANDISSP